jgi:hypothetical protein
MALAQVGFITPPHEEPDGYTFRLTPDQRHSFAASPRGECETVGWRVAPRSHQRRRGKIR